MSLGVLQLGAPRAHPPSQAAAHCEAWGRCVSPSDPRQPACLPAAAPATAPEHTIVLCLHHVPSPAFEANCRAARARSVFAFTALNAHSSRSHAIVMLTIAKRPRIAPGPRREQRRVRVGRLFLVDLAGSERLKKSRSTGAA